MLDCLLVSDATEAACDGANVKVAIEGFRVAEKALEEWKKEGKVKAKL